jgi:uncharacterized protein YhfF
MLSTRVADLVMLGAKHATAGSVWAFEAEHKDLPKPGDLSIIVTAWEGSLLYVVETVSVDIVPFDEVTAELAATEGAGDDPLRTGRGATPVSSAGSARIGRAFSGAKPVACESFKVVFMRRAPSAA